MLASKRNKVSQSSARSSFRLAGHCLSFVTKESRGMLLKHRLAGDM